MVINKKYIKYQLSGKLYRSLWQFASINELKNILSAAVIDSIANVFFI